MLKLNGGMKALILPMKKIIRGLSYGLLLFSLSASAQWQRIVMTDKGGPVDSPVPHPLSYWTGDPFLRDEPNDFCFSCHLENGHAVTEKDYTSECHTLDLGTLANYPIKEFRCHFTGSPEVSSIFSTEDYKFILVGVGKDQYREIYHLQANGKSFTPLTPARVVDMETESILATYDVDNRTCSEGYWWFDAAGPHQLNFDAVGKAIAQRLPHNATFTMSCWALDLDHKRIKTWAQRADAECRACGGLGDVTAYFVLHGAKAEPGIVDFEPDQNQ